MNALVDINKTADDATCLAQAGLMHRGLGARRTAIRSRGWATKWSAGKAVWKAMSGRSQVGKREGGRSEDEEKKSVKTEKG